MCFGLPVGAGLSLMGLGLGTILPGGLIGSAFIASIISSGWCWFVRVVLAKLGEDSL